MGAGGRRPIIAANWKMHKTHLEAIQAVQKLSYLLDKKDADAAEVVICPPFTALRSLQTLFDADRLPYGLGAQDVHWEEKGAFTGQISATMVRGLAEGAIVGHSEVRRDQGDDDVRVARKLARAVAAGLRPILCVGESEAEFVAGESTNVVARQISADLAALVRGSVGRLVVAYEPIWAIGTGRPATGAHATAAARAIRTALRGMDVDADAVPVLYGGSVSAKSVVEFARADGIDGALVGGASLDPDEFGAIVRAFT